MKLIIIGLDGATWKVITPLMEMNKLPNIAKIVENGVHGNLESTFPPVTGPAWLSMATGKNPGKTGVFDFINKDENGFLYNVINSDVFRKNNPYWDILNKYNYRSYILNYPMLYPYYEIDGVMIGGICTPTNAKLTYPNSLEKEINKISDGYWTRVDWNSPKYYNKKRKFTKDLNILIDKQFKTVKYLINQNWDFLIHVSNASDFLQHVMWEDWINKNSKYHNDFITVWEKLDKEIGSILKSVTDTNIFIVSDHGFGQLKENFQLGLWLVRNKYIKKKYLHPFYKEILFLINVIFKKFKKSILFKYVDIDEYRLNLLKSNILAKKLNLGIPIAPEINISKSKVIPHSSGIFGGIYLKGSQDIYDEYINEITKELKKLEDIYNIKMEIFTPEEIYWGEKTHRAPDLMFIINNYRCNIDTIRLKGDVFTYNPGFKNKTGGHRRFGIFCAYGPDIKNGYYIQGTKIYDLAPTILYMFGVPIPSDIDGKVLKNIFKNDSEIITKEIKYSAYDKEKDFLNKKIRNLKLNGKI